jgi:hypothetical protein
MRAAATTGNCSAAPNQAVDAANDPGRLDLGPRSGTGHRAGDQHFRMVDCLRGQVFIGLADHELGQLAGNRHR